MYRTTLSHLLLSSSKKATFFFIMLIGTMTLSGCEKDNASSQVIAKVNGTEITIHQLNNEIAVQKNISKQQILENIINRSLFIETAKREKLDRDPEVMQEIERQKSIAIANSLIKNKIPKNQLSATEQEIATFYNQNPSLFGDRKLWYSTEITIHTNQLNPILKSKLTEVATSDELIQLLYKENILFSSGSMTRATSDFPDDIIPKLVNGAKFTIPKTTALIFIFINNSSNASLSLQEATPTIKDYLHNQRFQDRVIKLTKDLRAAASIEYVDKSFSPKPVETVTPHNVNNTIKPY